MAEASLSENGRYHESVLTSNKQNLPYSLLSHL